MGWVKVQVKDTNDIVNDIVNNITWKGTPKGNTTPYEFFTDYIRDNYDVTLKQCDEICGMLKQHFNIKHFYYGE